MKVITSEIIIPLPAWTPPAFTGYRCFHCQRFLRLKLAVREPLTDTSRSILFCSTTCHRKQCAVWKGEGW